MGLLKAEQKDIKAAEEHLRKAVKADKQMHQGSFQSRDIARGERPKGIGQTASQSVLKTRPTPRYGYTLAFFMQKHGDLENSGKMLERMLERWPAFGDAYLLLGDMYQRQNKKDKASALYKESY